jgi:D-inositol-3-phosphate glycosyltransferase
LRVAMVSEHASPLASLPGSSRDAGGQNVFVADLSRALAKRGIAITVYTRRDDCALPGRVQLAPGVVVEHVDAGPPEHIFRDDLLPHMRAFGRRLRRAWELDPPDLVHAHHWMSGLAALAAAEPLGIPVVQTFHMLGVVKRRHQGHKDTSPPERIDLERRIAQRAQRVLATCSDELFELVRLGADARLVDIVPCGVDLALFKPSGSRMARRAGLQRLVVVSRLVERKGIGNTISALAHIPNCELLIAGGPEPQELERDPEAVRLLRLAEQQGVSERVHLLGGLERRQVPELMRSADAVVSVPWYEPFGLVAVEAMACGVPVVASAVGGQVDTVVDGLTGLHVPARSPRKLAERLLYLLRRPALGKRMGQAGAERASQRYGWDAVAAATHVVYSELAGARSVALGARR